MRVTNKRTIPAMVAMALVTVATAWYAPQSAYAASTIAAAARTDDLAQSRELITAGEDVNLAEPDGTTALLWAVYNSSPELVDLLLDAGADANVANQLDITPLLQASRYGNAEMISALLSNGAKSEIMGFGVETVLMAAARSGNPEAVQALLDAGINPDQTGSLEEQTALMWAASEGHIEAVKVLLNADANPDLTARVSDLTKRVNADFPSGGFAALHWAARNGDEDMINLLIEGGADIDVRNGDNATPMMLAIVNDRFDTAKMLLDLGANANDGSLYYITEMRDATHDWLAHDSTKFRADHNNAISAIELTRALLEEGADPNLPLDMQMHSASMCCDIKANATPFFRAAVAADIEGLTLMIEHGADANWVPLPAEGEEIPTGFGRGNIGKSMLMVALAGGKGVGISGGPGDLREGPADFREDGNRSPVEAVNLLLEANADVDLRNLDEDTALHLAANAGQIDIVRALVAKGASLDAENKDGYTPLQLVENTTPRVRRTDRYDPAPPAEQDEIIALLTELASR